VECKIELKKVLAKSVLKCPPSHNFYPEQLDAFLLFLDKQVFQDLPPGRVLLVGNAFHCHVNPSFLNDLASRGFEVTLGVLNTGSTGLDLYSMASLSPTELCATSPGETRLFSFQSPPIFLPNPSFKNEGCLSTELSFQYSCAAGFLEWVESPESWIKLFATITQQYFLLEGHLRFFPQSNAEHHFQGTSTFSDWGRIGGLSVLSKYFQHVGFPLFQPPHPQYCVDWEGEDSPTKQNRCLMVGSHHPLPDTFLHSTPPMRQQYWNLDIKSLGVDISLKTSLDNPSLEVGRLRHSLSVLIVSHCPEKTLALLNQCVEKALNPWNVEFVCILPTLSQVQRNQFLGFQGASVVIQEHSETYSPVQGWNAAAFFASGDLFIPLLITFTSGFVPVQNWDQKILSSGINPQLPQVLQSVLSGVNFENLVGFPIVTRPFYNQFGYLFHPSYEWSGFTNELSRILQNNPEQLIRLETPLFERHFYSRAVSLNTQGTTQEPWQNWGEVSEECQYQCYQALLFRESQGFHPWAYPHPSCPVQKGLSQEPLPSLSLPHTALSQKQPMAMLFPYSNFSLLPQTGVLLTLVLFNGLQGCSEFVAHLSQEIDQIQAEFAASQRMPIKIEVMADLSAEYFEKRDSRFQSSFQTLLHLYAMANGRFVWGVDDTSKLPSGFLRELVEVLLRNPDASFIRFGFCLEEETGQMKASVSQTFEAEDAYGMEVAFAQPLSSLTLWPEGLPITLIESPADHRMCWSKEQLFGNAESWPHLEGESLHKSTCSLSKLFQIHFSSAYESLGHTVMLHQLLCR
jgi:hypothetical protein